MAKNNYEIAIQNWQRRHAEAQAKGIPLSAYYQLATTDLQNTFSGGTPMADSAVFDQVTSYLAGRPLVGQAPHSGSAWEQFPKNVGEDVSGIVMGLPRGLYNLVRHFPSLATKSAHDFSLLDPSKKAEAQEAGFEDKGLNIPAALRDAARIPLINALVPGIHTLAGLTTPQGRHELGTHPVTTALDVLPIASHVGEAAAIAHMGPEVAAAVEDAAKGLKGRAKVVAERSALSEARQAGQIGPVAEALAGGRPIRAAVRGLGEVADQIPGLRAVGGTYWSQKLMDATLSPQIREGLARPFNIIRKQAHIDLQSFVNKYVKGAIDKLTEEQRAEAYQYATHLGTTGPVPPEYQAIIDNAQLASEKFAQESEAQAARRGRKRGPLVQVPLPNGQKEWYAAGEDVSKAWRRANSRVRNTESALRRLNSWRDRVGEWSRKVDERSQKVRRYGESDTAYAARGLSGVSTDTVREATTQLNEAFIHFNTTDASGLNAVSSRVLEPILTKVMEADNKTAIRFVMKDLKELAGDNGLFSKFDDALKSGEAVQATREITKIVRILRHKSWSSVGIDATLHDYMLEVKDSLLSMKDKTRAFMYAQKRLESAAAHVTKYEDIYSRRSKELADLHQAFLKELIQSPSARFHPFLVDQLRQGAANIAKQYQLANLDSVLHDIATTPYFNKIAEAIGETEWKTLWTDVTSSWLNLADKGLDPVWMHAVRPESFNSLMYPSPLAERYFQPSQWKEKTFNFAPVVQDVAASVTGAAKELIQQEATRRFIEDHVMKFVYRKADIEEATRSAIGEKTRSKLLSVTGESSIEMNKHWEEFHPDQYGIGHYVNITKGEELVIPKGVARALRMMKQDYRHFEIPVNGLYDRVMNVYKFSVLTGPRHIAHVAFGGLAFLMLRDPEAIRFLPRAWKMVSDHEEPIQLMQGMYGNTDALYHFSVGNTLARHLKESGSKLAHGIAGFEERLANWQRTADYLTQTSHGLSHDLALQEAYKTFVDMDGLAPVERVIIKQVFPFYAFTRHLFRYLLTYPTDHPYRAAILSKFATQENEEWASGLPQKYQFLFWLGKPDAHGNVNAVDLKSLNPFRSLTNDFTLAGFVSSLNPLITAPFEAMGGNVLSGSVDLYPQLSYDPQTGDLVAKRQNVATKIGESFIPEIGAIDHFIQMSDQMRRLKKSNPGAYRRLLYSNLNLPFSYSTYNVPYTIERDEAKQLKVAQQNVSQAFRTGNFALLKGYDLVPWRGGYYTPAQLEAVYNLVMQQEKAAGMTGVSPAALIPHQSPRRRNPNLAI